MKPEQYFAYEKLDKLVKSLAEAHCEERRYEAIS